MGKLLSQVAAVTMAFAMSLAPSLAQAAGLSRSASPASKAPAMQWVDNTQGKKVDPKLLAPFRQAASSSSAFATVRTPQALVKKADRVKANAAATVGCNLIGCVTYSEEADIPYGWMYTLADYEVYGENEVNFLSSGVSLGDTYKATYIETFLGFVLGAYTIEYDIETFEMVGLEEAAVDQVALAMAYNGTEIYGFFYNGDLSGYEFGTMDPNTMERTGTISEPVTVWYAMSFDAAGQLYAVTGDGELVKVDLESGDTEVVLEDEALLTQYLTSGAIDPKTNVMYYATSTDFYSNLLAIDLNTLEISVVSDKMVEIQGMYVGAPLAEEGAPAAPENVVVNTNEDSLTATVSFTAPSTTFAGEELTGELDYNVLANGAVVASGKVEAGNDAQVEITLPESGMYSIQVVCINSVGASPKSAKVAEWIGADAPMAPADVVLDFYDDSMDLRWEPVTESVHGGYFDAEKVTYTVYRTVNGNSVLVESGIEEPMFFEEFAEPNALTIISYSVVAEFNGVSSASAQSNVIALGHIIPPFMEDFSEEGAINKYTIIDANGDGTTWKESYNEVTISWNSSEDMDDWLITPAVELEAGKAYDFAVGVHANSTYWQERIEVMLGTAPEADAMEGEIIPPTDVVSTDVVELENTIVVAESGLYYIGIHGISDADQLSLAVRSISISAPYSANGPAQVTDVKFAAQYDGSCALDITFNAPKMSVSGKDLTAIEKIEVLRDEELVKTFENPAPGAALGFKDEAPEGDYLYTFVAYTEEGPGKSFNARAHMGINLAAAPVDAKAVENPNKPGYVNITFEPVATDVYGTPIDPALITYTILDSNQDVVVEGITAEEAAYGYQAIEGDQQFMYWFIIPVTAAGENLQDGGYATTEMIAVGDPYEMPFVESVANGELNTIWAYGGDGTWNIVASVGAPACAAEDGGMFVWQAGIGEGATSELFSGKVMVAESENVGFSFRYFANSDECYAITPIVKLAGYTYELETIKSNEGVEGMWNRVIIPLVDYCGQAVELGVKVECLYYTEYLCLDDFEAREFEPFDLSIESITAPRSIEVGKDGLIKVVVANLGTQPVDNYSVVLYRDGNAVETVDLEGLKAGGLQNVIFKQTPELFWDGEVTYYAAVECAQDKNDENNMSMNLRVIIAQSMLPAIEDLAGELNEAGAVALTWTAPDTSAKMEEYVDDVESYESYAIDNAGDWTFMCENPSGKYSFNGIDWPGAYQPGAFVVFDNSLLDTPIDDLTHSGDKVFACFAATSAPNDDWMISPELPGIAQTVSFFAKTYTDQYGDEEFEFYYSTSSPALSDMELLDYDYNVPSEWTEYSFDLPEGAKYFAIRCVSNDRFIFLVDDISFTRGTAELHLIRYDIYRDQELIGDTTETTYVDTDVEESTLYTYNVVAVYEEGISAPSNAVEVDVTGIADTKVLTSIRVEGNQIVVEGAEKVTIAAADGKLIPVAAGQVVRATVAPGVYVVRTNDRVAKVIVK